MQHDESLTIGTDEQMVEVMPGGGVTVSIRPGNRGHFGK